MAEMNEKKKKVTIKDIADACGVSTATVSYVVNGREDQRISPETRKRVLHEVHLMGYESSAVAKALATGNSCAVGLFAPHAAESAASAHAFAAFASALAPALEQRGYTLRIIGDACVTQTIKTIDAIVTMGVDRDTFLKIGFNCFYPLICVDGIIEEPDLFYQVNCDYAAAARRASEHAAEVCALLRPFAEPKLNRRIERCFDAVCFDTSDGAVADFLQSRPEGSVCVALGGQLAERARRFACGKVLSLCPGGDIELPSAAMADTVAGLVYDTIRKSAAPGHDIIIS